MVKHFQKVYIFSGNGKFDLAFLDPALQFCTHLIYGYAGIKEENFNIIPLDESLDINKQNYKQVSDLKRRFPGLRVLLSVGGNRDIAGEDSDKNLKYRTLVSFVVLMVLLPKTHSTVGVGGKSFGFRQFRSSFSENVRFRRIGPGLGVPRN